jgi:hypothetical protein
MVTHDFLGPERCVLPVNLFMVAVQVRHEAELAFVHRAFKVLLQLAVFLGKVVCLLAVG